MERIQNNYYTGESNDLTKNKTLQVQAQEKKRKDLLIGFWAINSLK